MGLSGFSLGHILVVLLIVILLFGTKKLGSIGSDLGEAIKGFRKAMTSSDDAADASKLRDDPDRSRDEPPNGRS